MNPLYITETDVGNITVYSTVDADLHGRAIILKPDLWEVAGVSFEDRIYRAYAGCGCLPDWGQPDEIIFTKSMRTGVESLSIHRTNVAGWISDEDAGKLFMWDKLKKECHEH